MVRITAVRFTQLLLNLVNLRDLFGVGTKLKNNIFKNNIQISFTVTTKTSVLSTEWARAWPSIGTRMKKLWWFPFFWTLDAVIQGAWVLYRIKKDKDEKSLPAFRRRIISIIFLKYSKEGRFSWSHLGIRNIPLAICYFNAKHYHVQSEHRRIRTPSNV